MSKTPEEIKHLEFVQNVIARMNSNSFQIKGISITIIAALFAVYAAKPNVVFILIAIIPTILFWLLDAYYLQQERKYRLLYDNISGLKNNMVVPLFSMSTEKIEDSITDVKEKRKYNYFYVLLSDSLSIMYLPLILLLIIISLIMNTLN